MSAIFGVTIKPLRKICDERGKIMHMLRVDDPLFEHFGEIYFSTAYPGIVKGWHLHTKQTLNYAVIMGMIKLVLFDARESSPTRGVLEEHFIGEDNYCLAKVPPGIYNGYKAIGMESAIVANCATHPYEEGEMTRLDPSSRDIPYSWAAVHR
jgi:dTDP-4-dehydrorhamnose 3,5-epimerase